ncbi:MAG: mechanosensitive ion channel [Phenylobacterium sp.]|uniref:mechanosensitive ion channel n=1 Tax=Phenylobacterium sp. TaxID=1871053 RepID=UPI00271F66B3|nr:mechanosensitive ion channel [Phenylobacterium sp.]MDO8902269.1 mechanosensitive ion channel [Phenylobacterium sp.]
MDNMQFYRAGDLLAFWGPRVLAALLIIVVAHFVAKAVQWGMAKLIDRFPGAASHNRDLPPKETLGYQLGQLGYWLVLLIGVIAALSVVQLTGVVGPLNALTVGVLSYVPNLIGAAVIFFVGLVIATLARRVVEAGLGAARVDHWLDRAGLGRLTGAAGLARTAGLLVFVLIIIPVTIAALEQLGVAAISDPAVAVLAVVLDAIPRVLAAAIVLAIAFVIGRWVAGLIEQILPSLGFDRSLQGLWTAGATTPVTPAPNPFVPPADPVSNPHPAPAAPASATYLGGVSVLTPSKVVARIVLAAIMLFSAIEAARLLSFLAIAAMLEEVVRLGGQVIFGGVIITIGVLLGNFLARVIDRSTGGAGGFASTIVRWATIALATAMGLRFMGIADEIVVLAFGLILGSAAVAAAIAFGFGGRETAHRLLERWTRKAEREGGPPPV